VATKLKYFIGTIDPLSAVFCRSQMNDHMKVNSGSPLLLDMSPLAHPAGNMKTLRNSATYQTVFLPRNAVRREVHVLFNLYLFKHNLYSSPNIMTRIRVIKSRTLRLAWHVAQIAGMRKNLTQLWHFTVLWLYILLRKFEPNIEPLRMAPWGWNAFGNVNCK
jgi:hypothetical protein